MLSRKLLGIPVWVIALVVVVVGGLVTVGGGVLLYNLYTGNGWQNPIECADSAGCSILHPILYSLAVIFIVVTGFAYTTLLERKFIAWFQQRVGPNRVGPSGLLQPAADGLKLIFKEDIMPKNAYKGVYLIAPMLKAIPTLIVLAVIPLGPPIVLPWFDGNWYRVPLHLATPNVGVLWLLAVTSVGTYGVTLAGWASNNKYSMIGGLRASAQMISYELSLGLSMVVPIILASSMSVSDIVAAQSGSPLNWFVFQNPLAAFIMIVALIAEVNRAPFDLPEAEQELTAGYMTEYSGMKFALFMMAEYLGMIAVSLIAVSMFFGGFHVIAVDSVPILGPLFVIGKVVLCLIGFVWIRATLPRIRYDRLMNFGWKVMLPLALLAVAWSAIAVVVAEEFGQTGYLIISGILFVGLLVFGYFFLLREPNAAAVEIEEVEDDPIITGQRRDIGYVVMTIIGGLLALPFGLYNYTLKVLDGLAGLSERAAKKAEEKSAEKPASGD